MSLFAPTAALGQQTAEEPISFDIPAEPLNLALDAYTMATGKSVLVDGSLVIGRHSTTVNGLFTPDNALQTLLKQTGLVVQNEDRLSFTLTRGPLGGSQDHSGSSNDGSSDYWPYIATVQAALHNVLCERAETQPGSYRVGIQLWVGESGDLTRFDLVGSTGSRDRDKAVIGALTGLAISEPPPPDLPEPLSLLIVPLSTPNSTDCPNYPSLP